MGWGNSPHLNPSQQAMKSFKDITDKYIEEIKENLDYDGMVISLIHKENGKKVLEAAKDNVSVVDVARCSDSLMENFTEVQKKIVIGLIVLQAFSKESHEIGLKTIASFMNPDEMSATIHAFIKEFCK